LCTTRTFSFWQRRAVSVCFGAIRIYSLAVSCSPLNRQCSSHAMQFSTVTGVLSLSLGGRPVQIVVSTATLEAYSKSKSDRTEAIGADQFIRPAREIGQRRVFGVVFASSSLNETSWEELSCQLQ